MMTSNRLNLRYNDLSYVTLPQTMQTDLISYVILPLISFHKSCITNLISYIYV